MSETERFDLVVIGSGPAGEKGAAQAAYFGKRVALVERWKEPGGVTVHTGTLPSKTLREAALYLTGFHRRKLYGMTLRLDRKKSLRQLVGRLRDVTDRQIRQIKRNLERHRIETVHGSARFLDPKTVAVLGPDGAEARRLSADVFLVAVGSSPLPPRGLTFEDPDVENSDTILDLDRIPTSLAVVGGGVIGSEYASIFAALGSKVTLLEGRDRLMGFLDSEVSAAFKVALGRMGGDVLLGDAVEKLHREPGEASNALRLTLKSGRVLSADKVLFSAGRRGNTDGLGLEAAGVLFDEKGKVAVDESFRTNVPGIYAAGDVIGFPALSATSMEQGRVAMCHAFDLGFKQRVSSQFPYGVYTVPEISMIGATEEELKEKALPYEAGRARWENNARGQITGDPDGFVKLLFDPASKKLLGVHLIGGGATELVHVAQMVMDQGRGLEAFLSAVFNFPTLSECFKYAAYDGLQRLSHRGGGAPLEGSLEAGARLSPGARAWFVGVDLGDPFAKRPKPVTVAFMDRWHRVSFHEWTYDASGDGLVPEEKARGGFVVGFDGPLALARPGTRLREAERELRAAGKTPDARPEPGSAPYAGFIAGSLDLCGSLRKKGWGLLGVAPHDDVAMFEVYPGDVWPKWAGKKLAKKTTPEGLRDRYDLLRARGVELPGTLAEATHDRLDAAAAAYVAYLWATGKATEFGPDPFEEAGALREGKIVSIEPLGLPRGR